MLNDMSENHKKSRSEPENARSSNQDNERDGATSESIGLPDLVASSGALDRLVDTARDYARQATSENTNLAYKKDWAHFNS